MLSSGIKTFLNLTKTSPKSLGNGFIYLRCRCEMLYPSSFSFSTDYLIAPGVPPQPMTKTSPLFFP